MRTLGIIGAGNIATAISRGILNKGALSADQMMVYDIDPGKLQPFAQAGIPVAADAGQLVEECRLILLAVKPQSMLQVLEGIRPHCKGNNLFISVAAGISAQSIKEALGYDAKVVLVMPNTPILVRRGASALARVEPATQQEFEEVRALFAASGETVEIRPDQMREIIALNGSSPAFIYRFTQIFVDHAAELGIDRDVANHLFCHTLIGAAHMMLETGKTHQELIDVVSSKGGTTVAGLAAMEEHRLKDALVAGYDACTRRAYELGS
jgi:pyrroline-5-carboxylate reductase